jgi:glycosyltransferase involved in cell wall biosynthesis
MLPAERLTWSVAVFVKDEAQTILKCLSSISEAVVEEDAHLFLFVNGSTDRTLQILQNLSSNVRNIMSVFQIAYADKSNAWNQYVHAIRPRAQVHFFVDGYVWTEASAFAAMATTLKDAPTAHAANGAVLPDPQGRTQMMPGLHGSLHALRGTFVDRLRDRNIRLPIGLYWGDGLIGAMAHYDLDVIKNSWDNSRVLQVSSAVARYRKRRFWRRHDVMRHARRLVRQAQGRMQNAALKELVKSTNFEGLPRYAPPMVVEWVDRDPTTRKPRPHINPIGYLAYREMLKWRPPAAAACEAKPVNV